MAVIIIALALLLGLPLLFLIPKAFNRPRDWDKLIGELCQWASKTFPNSTPVTTIAHLRLEVEELQYSPQDGEEMADIFMILAHYADRQGIDLYAEVRRKLAINKRRKWASTPDAEEGIIRHVA